MDDGREGRQFFRGRHHVQHHAAAAFGLDVNSQKTLSKGDEAMVFIRPEAMGVTTGRGAAAVIDGVIEEEEFEGPNYHLFVRLKDDKHIKVSLVNRGHAQRSAPGSRIKLTYEPAKAIALPKGKLAVDYLEDPEMLGEGDLGKLLVGAEPPVADGVSQLRVDDVDQRLVASGSFVLCGYVSFAEWM